jgi:maltooligosyltrehalose trehalohydrolase
MPVAQFPGDRNWGYDGVHPFAVQNSYGGPRELKMLVDACHERGLAVILDVVYNHIGPEGNYFSDFGPYFTDRYRTPWGAAINFDGPFSDDVRRYFIENALYWISDFHIDCLRLDAVHSIFDVSAWPFLAQLANIVHRRAEELNRRIYLIAESDLNDSRLISHPLIGGYGIDAQWSDDLHHSLHTLLTGEKAGYYEDFGRIGQLADAIRNGFVYSGQFSQHRRRRHGNSPDLCESFQFVVSSQNHDQVGNRMLGERLSQLISFEALKLAAGTVIFSPNVPLLFMGEEYGETAPFQYFISHLDTNLIEAVRQGREEEFSAFGWKGTPPDPQDSLTFERCKLNHELKTKGRHQVLIGFYREIIALRKHTPSLALLSRERVQVFEYPMERTVTVRRWTEDDEVVILLHFSELQSIATLTLPSGHWHRALSSAEKRWDGQGSEVPEEIYSSGEVKLNLRQWELVVFRRALVS